MKQKKFKTSIMPVFHLRCVWILQTFIMSENSLVYTRVLWLTRYIGCGWKMSFRLYEIIYFTMQYSTCRSRKVIKFKFSGDHLMVIRQLYNLLSDATDMVFTLWVVHDRHHWKTESRNIKAFPLSLEKLHGGVDSFVSNWNCRNSSQATSSLEN